MRLVFSVLLLSLSLTVGAFSTVTTRIHDIDRGHEVHEDNLVFLSSGQVAKLSPHDPALLDQLSEAKYKDLWLSITMNEKREIIALTEVPAPIDTNPELSFAKGLLQYIPSVIPSPEAAQLIFRDTRIKHKDSQCYNRAHIWSYEWRAKHTLFTSKIWLFFTRKYIRKFNFEWWFHVAPYFHVLEGDKVWERVADVKYSRGPLKIKQWTDIFLRNDAKCPEVEKYSDQANYPESAWCFLMKSSMYYYQPIDLEVLDRDGTEKNLWNPSEVRQAYKEAFDIDV